MSVHLSLAPFQKCPVHCVPEDVIDDKADETQDQHVDHDLVHLVQVIIPPYLLTKAKP